MLRFTRRYAAVVAVAACAAASLTGCTSDPGAAALIGSYRISDSQVHGIVDEVLSNKSFASELATQNVDRADLTRDELSSLIQLQLLKSAAADLKIIVTPAELQTYVTSIAAQYGGLAALQKEAAAQGTPPALLDDALLESLLIGKIDTVATGKQSPSRAKQNQIFSSVMVTETAKHGVHVSPRYGSWNAEQGDVIAPGDTLSKAAPTHAPAVAPIPTTPTG